MPGETLEEAVVAAAELRELGLATVLTELGENVSNAAQADQVVRPYVTALEAIGARGLDCHISVKLTHLGLDVDPARCRSNLRALLAHAKERSQRAPSAWRRRAPRERRLSRAIRCRDAKEKRCR